MKNRTLFLVNEDSLNSCEEDCMEKYSSWFEEVLCEIFNIEYEDSLESINDDAIYDLSDEKDIQQRQRREAAALNEGSAPVEDMKELERQALEYFKNPDPVYYPSEGFEASDTVTGFIQLFNGVSFTGKGELREAWRSSGRRVTCRIDDLYLVESIEKKVMDEGYDLKDRNVRIVFYGSPLESITGRRAYKKGERKVLEPLVEGGGIMLAIPAEIESDSSVFKNIDMEVRDSILTGREVDYDSIALSHWRLTHERLDELKLVKSQELELERISAKERRYVEKRNQFDENFKRAREVIRDLNDGTIKPQELDGESTKVFAQVMYLSNKQGERIEKKEFYFQIKSMLKRRKVDELGGLMENSSALKIIAKVNNGVDVEVHLLNLADLEAIFSILWGQAGIRIDAGYKEKYFKLKERYSYLKKINSDKAA
jgi:hypothetical protein